MRRLYSSIWLFDLSYFWEVRNVFQVSKPFLLTNYKSLTAFFRVVKRIVIQLKAEGTPLKSAENVEIFALRQSRLKS